MNGYDEGGPVKQPERVIVGFCPVCQRLIVMLNNHESWPLAVCECGVSLATDNLERRVRYEHNPYGQGVIAP